MSGPCIYEAVGGHHAAIGNSVCRPVNYLNDLPRVSQGKHTRIDGKRPLTVIDRHDIGMSIHQSRDSTSALNGFQNHHSSDHHRFNPQQSHNLSNPQEQAGLNTYHHYQEEVTLVSSKGTQGDKGHKETWINWRQEKSEARKKATLLLNTITALKESGLTETWEGAYDWYEESIRSLRETADNTSQNTSWILTGIVKQMDELHRQLGDSIPKDILDLVPYLGAMEVAIQLYKNKRFRNRASILALASLLTLMACDVPANSDSSGQSDVNNAISGSTLCTDGSGKSIQRPAPPLPSGVLCNSTYGLPTGETLVLEESGTNKNLRVTSWDGAQIRMSELVEEGSGVSIPIIDKSGTLYSVDTSGNSIQVTSQTAKKTSALNPPSQVKDKVPPTATSKPTNPAPPKEISSSISCPGVKVAREVIIGCPSPYTVYEGGTGPLYTDANGTQNKTIEINPEAVAQTLRQSGNTSIREVHIVWGDNANSLSCGKVGFGCNAYGTFASILPISISKDVPWNSKPPEGWGDKPPYNSNLDMLNAILDFELHRQFPQYRSSGDDFNSPLFRDYFWKPARINYFILK